MQKNLYYIKKSLYALFMFMVSGTYGMEKEFKKESALTPIIPTTVIVDTQNISEEGMHSKNSQGQINTIVELNEKKIIEDKKSDVSISKTVVRSTPILLKSKLMKLMELLCNDFEKDLCGVAVKEYDEFINHDSDSSLEPKSTIFKKKDNM